MADAIRMACHQSRQVDRLLSLNSARNLAYGMVRRITSPSLTRLEQTHLLINRIVDSIAGPPIGFGRCHQPSTTWVTETLWHGSVTPVPAGPQAKNRWESWNSVKNLAYLKKRRATRPAAEASNWPTLNEATPPGSKKQCTVRIAIIMLLWVWVCQQRTLRLEFGGRRLDS